MCHSASTSSSRSLSAYRKSLPYGKRPASPNDFHPVALTSHLMKSFENFLQNHDHEPYSPSSKPYTICISAWEKSGGRSHNLVHLEKAKTHARVLYLDLSSAFNTLQLHLLFNKIISEFKLESDLALWVLEFLVGRPEQVRVNDTMSSVKVVSTGTLQGCVLSPCCTSCILMTAGAPIPIGFLLNSQMTQLYSVCCLMATVPL